MQCDPDVHNMSSGVMTKLRVWVHEQCPLDKWGGCYVFICSTNFYQVHILLNIVHDIVEGSSGDRDGGSYACTCSI